MSEWDKEEVGKAELLAEIERLEQLVASYEFTTEKGAGY